MGKLVFGMMQSLDGYVAGVAGGPELPPPGIALHRYFNDHVRSLAGILYGRRMYEVMRYWDEDRPEWGAVEHEFAAAWRAQPKWVASRSLKSVGANATLVGDDVGAFVRRLNRSRGRHRRRRARAGGEAYRPWSRRRVSSLLSSVRAWPRQAVLRRCPSAAPPRRHQSRWRGCGRADVRHCLIAYSEMNASTSTPCVARRSSRERRARQLLFIGGFTDASTGVMSPDLLKAPKSSSTMLFLSGVGKKAPLTWNPRSVVRRVGIVQ
jgi:hypothetical protein